MGEPVIGFDTESVGPRLVTRNKMINIYCSRILGFSIATPSMSTYVPLGHPGTNLPMGLAAALLEEAFNNRKVWAHNWKHDVYVLRSHSLPEPKQKLDSLLAAWLSGTDGPFGLKALAGSIFGKKLLDYNPAFPTWYSDKALEYAANDAYYSLRIGTHFGESHQLPFEMELLEVLREMETYGMAINARGLSSLAKKLNKRIKALEDQWEGLLPNVDIASPSQLRTLFSGTWTKKGVARTPKGAIKVDKETLDIQLQTLPKASLGYQLAEIKQEYQSLSKVVSTYTHTLVSAAQQHVDGRLHGSFHQTGTPTGRLSSSDPNLQNIPARGDLSKLVRQNFVAPEGSVLVAADYSQIELRVLAHFCGEGRLLNAYRQDGTDVHQQTADLVGCSRFQGKTLVFATIYGAGPNKLAKLLGVNVAQAEEFTRAFFDAYPEILLFKEKVLQAVGARSPAFVQLPFSGRRRYFDTEKDLGWERKAVNTLIQGSAADLIRFAMVTVHKQLVLTGRAKLVSQVHDELVLEVKTDISTRIAERLTFIMEHPSKDLLSVPINVPLKAEAKIGKTWAECK
jgi:DNA polymerase-1